MTKIIGHVVDISEQRDVLEVVDTLGDVAELVPIEEDAPPRFRLKISMPLPSGRTIRFWVDAPPEVLPYFEEHQMARSVGELMQQLSEDLKMAESYPVREGRDMSEIERAAAAIQASE